MTKPQPDWNDCHENTDIYPKPPNWQRKTSLLT